MPQSKNGFIYMRVYNDLREKIESGEYATGTRLATETELKNEYSVSRDTMRKALAKLEADGYITRKVSLGTFVKTRKVDYAPQRFHESFTEQMLNLGKQPSSEILSIEILTEAEPDIAQQLSLSDGEKVYLVKRLRRADNEPMALEMAYVRQKYCPNLHTLLYENTSLYKLYEEHFKLDMGRVEIKIEALNADARQQKLLNLKSGAALLKMTSLMRLSDGSPLYYVLSYHVGEKYVFTTTLPRRL